MPIPRIVPAMEPMSEVDPEPIRGKRGCGGLFLCFMLLAAVAFGGGLGYFLHLLDEAGRTLDKANLHSFRPKVGSKVWSDNIDNTPSQLLQEFAIESRQVVPLNEMPLHLQKAFIATEDAMFYEHLGVRPDAIVKALLYIARTGSLRGGSTITQQLVRNIDRTGVTAEQTVSRKLNEALIAIQLEREFTKDEILELYLNQIFLGISAYGVEAASQQYFAKSCRDLTLAESALLAGLTRSPTKNQPLANPQSALARRNIVLGQMLEHKLITQEQYDEAIAATVEESVVTKEERETLRTRDSSSWQVSRAGYFVEEVRRLLSNTATVGEPRGAEENPVFESGLQIQTTLDMRLQLAAEKTLFQHLDEFDKKRLESLKKRGKESEFIPLSGALVCIDNRPGMKGYVRAMVGGRDFTKKKFNMATQARRQPGSSIKPFIWAAAIDDGMTASTIMQDTPFVQRYGNTVWSPKNFGGKFSGPVTMRRALEQSINTVSVRVVQRLGVPKTREYLERMGITKPIDPMAGLTLALGSSAVTVLDHCVAYSTFANGGWYYEPVLVKEIRDRDGLVIFDCERDRNRRSERQAIPSDVAYVVTHLMEGVVQFGTGFAAKKLERPCAGKTGTTNENRDTWFCGFTPDYTAVVWLGYEDNSPLGGNYTGGGLAAPIWTDFMREAHKGLPVKDFEVPDGVTMYNVDRRSGVAGGNFKEAFIRGTKPPTYTPPTPPEAVEAWSPPVGVTNPEPAPAAL